MSLFDIYKAKKLGKSSESLFASALGNKLNGSYEWVTEKVPYLKRQTANGLNVADACKDKIVGGSIVCNQLLSDAYSHIQSSSALSWGQLGAEFSLTKDHKYLATFNGKVVSGGNIGLRDSAVGIIYRPAVGYSLIYSASTNSTRSTFIQGSWGAGETDAYINVFDLTMMFGSAIADYIYSLEQAQVGAGVAYFKALGYDADYYSYDAGSLKSVGNISAHVMRDAQDDVIGNYPIDSSVTLRGKFKLDENHKLYADGDTYESNGTVTRNYGVRAYQSGDESLADAITDGTNTVYKLTTPTTETADPYASTQKVDPLGTEEYVVTTQSGFVVPVGHETQYKVYQE